MFGGLDKYSYIKFILSKEYDKDRILSNIETFKRSGDITEDQYNELIEIINTKSQDK